MTARRPIASIAQVSGLGSLLAHVARYSPYRDLPTNVYKGSLHNHTTQSDGDASAADMAAAFATAGYDFVGFTDHDVVTDLTGVTGILAIAGTEETCQSQHVASKYHHVCRLGNTSSVISQYKSEVFAGDGIKWLAHPGWYSVAPASTTVYSKWDILGLPVTHMGVMYPTVFSARGLWDYALSCGRLVFGVGEQDIHLVANVATSTVVNYVYADALTAEAILNSIALGRYYISGGPTLTIADSGSALTVTTPDSATIAFIGKMGHTLQSSVGTSATYTYRGDEGYVRCVVTRTSDSTIAMTNPVMFAPFQQPELFVLPGALGKLNAAEIQGTSLALASAINANSLANSDFAVDTNADGLSDNWTSTQGSLPNITRSRVAEPFVGTYAQRISVAASGTATNVGASILWQRTAAASYAPSENAVMSAWVRGVASGCSLQVYLAAETAANAYISHQYLDFTLTGGWQYVSIAYPNLPANTDHVTATFKVIAYDTGDSFTVDISAVKVEKAAYPTPWIPA